MPAGCRTDTRRGSAPTELPRPLSDDLPLPAPTRRRRGAPPVIVAPIGPMRGRRRGILVAACCLVAAALLALPALAQGCRPEARAAGEGIRLSGAGGVERVRLEIGYRRGGEAGARSSRTWYQVISAPVPADGLIDYRPPAADTIVSATVIEARGPACN
ncbi:hypothetical protein M1105_00775 [Limibaculum sp. FT325]|uniref:hypothetical protein n=1 Tax=Thermohalobaculum sediminis TaxID=2939436 RepID=UPI0020C05DA8|nr:hypothetical protein [Limibaculum sediminis]MCL5775528.1 hypothetical protein [Limibaculum sediminis]